MSVWDERMIEIAADRKSSTLQARELKQLSDSTEAIEQGMGNGLLWTFLVGGFVAAPFTGGISLIVSLVAGIAMSGGKHMVTDALPKTVDIVAPKAGCIRVLSALVALALMLLVAFVVGCVVFFNFQ